MAKPKKDRGQVKSIDVVDNNCLECKVVYQATKTTWQNGDSVISPPRCPKCQTIHLTNLRVNKTIKDIQLLGNLKARLSDTQRQAVLSAIGQEIQSLMDKYAGSTIKSSAFDLSKV